MPYGDLVDAFCLEPILVVKCTVTKNPRHKANKMTMLYLPMPGAILKKLPVQNICKVFRANIQLPKPAQGRSKRLHTKTKLQDMAIGTKILLTSSDP
jgi:ABC-type lipopolysaccharide export system ATPase subunit